MRWKVLMLLIQYYDIDVFAVVKKILDAKFPFC